MTDLLVCYRCLAVTPRASLADKYIKPLRRIVNKCACPKCGCRTFYR